MKLKDLKKFLNNLSEEQLEQDAKVFATENGVIRLKRCMVATENGVVRLKGCMVAKDTYFASPTFGQIVTEFDYIRYGYTESLIEELVPVVVQSEIILII